jgi:pimeloyl-ACP methyl ester carboxylesterase
VYSLLSITPSQRQEGHNMPFTTRVLTAGVAGVVLATSAAAGVSAAPARTTSVVASDRTSAVERKRVDSVKTPKLGWYTCYGTAECATVQLPLDYDEPNGAKTEVAVLRIKAKNQKTKIGSLFVNPGGPGGSGTQLAMAAPFFLSQSVLDRFDIVGVDPRGIANSQNVKCFPTTRDQTLAMAGLNVAFPVGRREEAAYTASAKAVGRACSTTGRPLTGAMSTAEVARDMDVLRRAVGDKKLSYLGFSYGTALGQYYANMFPDRVRAVVVDGVINPVTWVGDARTGNQIQDDRLRSADGAYKALVELLRRCDKAGEKFCVFSAGDPVKNFDIIARKLRAKPLVITDGSGSITITYADFIGSTLGSLYSPFGASEIAATAADLWQLLSKPAGAAGAKSALVSRIREARRTAAGRDFPYDNSYETYVGVACTDGLHPSDARLWPALTAKSDKRAPYFGRIWGWGTVTCARNTWTVRDEDAYRGPFDRRTSSPVLVVGSFWDPATNYQDAVASARLLPNSRLLSSNNWGHTAYGTSPCSTNAIDAYLVGLKLPAKGKTCRDADQPFTQPLDAESATLMRAEGSKGELAAVAPSADAPKQLPPVAIRVPVSVLNGTR